MLLTGIPFPSTLGNLRCLIFISLKDCPELWGRWPFARKQRSRLTNWRKFCCKGRARFPEGSGNSSPVTFRRKTIAFFDIKSTARSRPIILVAMKSWLRMLNTMPSVRRFRTNSKHCWRLLRRSGAVARPFSPKILSVHGAKERPTLRFTTPC